MHFVVPSLLLRKITIHQWSTRPAHSPGRQWFSLDYEVLGRTGRKKTCVKIVITTGRDSWINLHFFRINVEWSKRICYSNRMHVIRGCLFYVGHNPLWKILPWHRELRGGHFQNLIFQNSNKFPSLYQKICTNSLHIV